MTAMAVGIIAMFIALAALTGGALWWAFDDFRNERLDRQAARQVHEARHDYVVAIGATNQRGLEGPTGQLEPAEIAKLLGGGR